jgi:hypothetical protein
MLGCLLIERPSTWRTSVWLDNKRMLQPSLKVQLNLDRVAKGGILGWRIRRRQNTSRSRAYHANKTKWLHLSMMVTSRSIPDAEIVGGQHARTRVFIPRIPLSSSQDISLPLKFKRKQFPIQLSFAMTINKAQGQTIPTIGIYLPEPVFSHGQWRGLTRKMSKMKDLGSGEEQRLEIPGSRLVHDVPRFTSPQWGIATSC